MTKIANNSNLLFFITEGFPFGKGETFIETEINYLCAKFERVIIISHDESSSTPRSVPNNVEIQKVSYTLPKKMASLRRLLNFEFLKELYTIIAVYKKTLSFEILKTMLVSLHNGSRLADEYIKISKKYDVSSPVYYSYWSDDRAIALAFLKKRNLLCNAVTRMHRWDIYFDQNECNYLPYRHFISKWLDTIYSISDDGLAYAKKVWKVKTDNIKVARLGIEPQNFVTETNNKDLLFLSCSNVVAVKRLDLLIKGLRLTANQSLRWVHIGSGTLDSTIKGLAKELLRDKEKFSFEFKGALTNSQVMAFYRDESPDLFINVSASEGIPVSIMEAMSFSTPVIATNVGGSGEIVNDKNGQLLVDHPTDKEIGDALNHFIQLSMQDKEKMKLAAFNTWKTYYNAEVNYSAFSDEIASL